jgi:outer membrane protein OmpA-like peptidoglycan-associated protein
MNGARPAYDRSMPARGRNALSCLIALLVFAGACSGASSRTSGGSTSGGSTSGGGSGQVVTSESSVEVLAPVEFAHDVKLKPSSYPGLEAIAKTLAMYPEIKLIEIAVFVLDGDDRAARQELADRRANFLYEWFIRKGIATERLDPQGYVAPDEHQTTSGVRIWILKRGPAS